MIKGWIIGDDVNKGIALIKIENIEQLHKGICRIIPMVGENFQSHCLDLYYEEGAYERRVKEVEAEVVGVDVVNDVLSISVNLDMIYEERVIIVLTNTPIETVSKKHYSLMDNLIEEVAPLPFFKNPEGNLYSHNLSEESKIFLKKIGVNYVSDILDVKWDEIEKSGSVSWNVLHNIEIWFRIIENRALFPENF